MRILTILLILANAAIAAPVINGVSENADTVSQYDKFELTINLTASFTKPFDPNPAAGGIDMWALFTSPTGVSKRANAFYMDTDNNGTADSWKVRFASGETGAWSYSVNVIDATGTGTPYNGIFQIAAGPEKGFIRKSQINPRFFVYEKGGSFWAIGHNQGWQYSEVNCPQCIENPDFSVMKTYGENTISFWINSPWRTPSSEAARSPMENSAEGAGNYNQRSAKYIDEKLEEAEANGIKVILSLWIHDALRDGSVTCWSGNDWSKLGYSAVTTARNFFDNTQLRTYQQNYYRYLAARYGYSRALFMWDMIVEANGTDRWCDGGQAAIESWLAWACSVMDWYDIYAHPRTASLGGGWDSWNTDNKWPNGYSAAGVSQIHSYEWKNDMAKMPRVIASNTQYMWNLNRPGYIGEYGSSLSSNQPVDIHRASWAALSSGASCGPMLWCDNGSFINMTTAMLQQQQYLASFTSGIDFENQVTAQKTIAGLSPNNYGWAVGSGTFAIGWIYNDSGNISQSNITVPGFNAGDFSILWYDTWTGNAVSNNTAASSAGNIALQVPVLARPDIAFKISVNVTPTNTATPGGPTHTYTPTYVPSSTPTATSTPARTPSAELSKAYIYPSVLREAKKERGIWFKGLTRNTAVYIYDMKGMLIFRHVSGTPLGELYWNYMKDMGIGNSPPSGLYIYVLTDEKKRQKTGKFAIIR